MSALFASAFLFSPKFLLFLLSESYFKRLHDNISYLIINDYLAFHFTYSLDRHHGNAHFKHFDIFIC